MLSLLIYILIVGLIFYVLYWAIAQIPLPPPFAVVARVVLAIAAVIVLLSLLLGGAPHMKLLDF